MDKKIDITITGNEPQNKLYPLASGYISTTTFFFEALNVIAVIHAEGTVELLDANGASIAFGKVENAGGKGKYEEAGFLLDGNRLTVRFPVYEWIDHYPNCDGEHDRWSSRIVDFHNLTLDLPTA